MLGMLQSRLKAYLIIGVVLAGKSKFAGKGVGDTPGFSA